MELDWIHTYMAVIASTGKEPRKEDQRKESKRGGICSIRMELDSDSVCLNCAASGLSKERQIPSKIYKLLKHVCPALRLTVLSGVVNNDNKSPIIYGSI